MSSSLLWRIDVAYRTGAPLTVEGVKGTLSPAVVVFEGYARTSEEANMVADAYRKYDPAMVAHVTYEGDEVDDWIEKPNMTYTGHQLWYSPSRDQFVTGRRP